MATEFSMLVAFTGITSAALIAAFVAWHHTVETYRSELSDRALAALRFGTPPAMLATAAPILDGAIWLAGGPFPLFGVYGVALGVAGCLLVLGYVALDLRAPAGVTRETDVEQPGAA